MVDWYDKVEGEFITGRFVVRARVAFEGDLESLGGCWFNGRGHCYQTAIQDAKNQAYRALSKDRR